MWKFLKNKPWILLVILFCLPLIGWVFLIMLAADNPVQWIETEPIQPHAEVAK